MMSEAALPEKLPRALRGTNETDEAAGETTPGGDRVVQWKVVAVTQGPTEAAIIRGRLESEGIPAWVQQESAGVAIGLTVGLLGEARVLVPEPLVDQALEILSEPVRGLESEEED